MLCAEHAPPYLRRLVVDPGELRELPLFREEDRKIERRAQRARVLSAEHAPLHLQRLAVDPDGLR